MLNHHRLPRRLGAWLAAACLATAAAQAPAPQPPAEDGSRNVHAAGGEVRPARPVRGDLMAAGGRVLLEQAVGGDALLAGGAVEVRAPVGEDLRAVGGSVTVEGRVGGDLFVAAGSASLRPSAAVDGEARLHAGHVTLDGRTAGDLLATAQKIVVNGEVRGKARLVAEDIELGPRARITGALTYSSPVEMRRAAGAIVDGPVTREAWRAGEGGQRRPAGPGFGAAGFAASYLALLACTAVFVLVAPGFTQGAAAQLRDSPWVALAVGFGALFGVPVLAMLLFITLLGIPLAFALLAMFPVLLLAGFVVGVLLVASLLAAGWRGTQPEALRARVGYIALGLLLVLAAGMVPLAGGMLLGLGSIAGLGAALLRLRAGRRPPGGAADGAADAQVAGPGARQAPSVQVRAT